MDARAYPSARGSQLGMTSDFDISLEGGRKTMWLDSSRIEECLHYFREHSMDRLVINPSRGFKTRDLSFLHDHPYVEDLGVVLPLRGSMDLSPLASLRSLKRLLLSDAVPFDLSQFPMLVCFHGAWHQGLHLEGCRLKELGLGRYRSKERDLTGLPSMPTLETFHFADSQIRSLRGLEAFPNLRHAELAYLPKLESLQEVESLRELEFLTFDTCRKLRDHAVVVALQKLKTLRFNECGPMATLSFLDSMPNLQEFRFVGTDVVDGDLHYLLRLASVAFTSKRHFSHKQRDVPGCKPLWPSNPVLEADSSLAGGSSSRAK